MWRKLIARYLLLARAILPLLRHTRGAARGRRKSPRRLLGLGSAAFSPFYCDKNPDGERPAFWKTGLRWPRRGGPTASGLLEVVRGAGCATNAVQVEVLSWQWIAEATVMY